MKTTKKILFFILATIGFFSCNKESDISRVHSIISDYDSIGIAHNQNLDSMLLALRAFKKSNKSINFYQATIICKDLNANYINVNFPLRDKEKALFFAQAPMVSSLSKLKSASNTSDSITCIVPENDTVLSDIQKQLLYELDSILSDSDTIVESLVLRVHSLETKAIALLSESELPVILASTSIAKNTMRYWAENYNDWAEILSSDESNNLKSCMAPAPSGGGSKFEPNLPGSNPSPQPSDTKTKSPNWKEAGKSDVGGAVSAATGLGFLRFLGPIGWKGWAVGTAGGAIGTSAQNIVDQLLLR